MNSRELNELALTARHDRRVSGVRVAIGRAPDTQSAREAFRQAVSDLPGVSGDPDTVADILHYADCLIVRKQELDGQSDTV